MPSRDSSATPPAALTISGSDPSGGAGLQTDLKAFQAHGVFGMAAVTLVTVQNTRGVERVEVLEPGLVGEQVCAVLADIRPAAAKTGSLGTAGVVETVAELWAQQGAAALVVDPVMVSKHGDSLVDGEFERAMAERLLPLAAWATPNRFEAERLLGRAIVSPQDLAAAAEALLELGPRRVLLKGGVLPGATEVVDVIAGPEGLRQLRFPVLDPRCGHGAGCLLSAALTARLARGEGDLAAAEAALAHVHRAMARGAGLGSGIRPPDPFTPLE